MYDRPLAQAFNQFHGVQCGYCTPIRIPALRAGFERTLDLRKTK
ncbi:hypothetical protein GNZ12_04375 [Paraburkholderia sp. 1N]|uniref:Uncharacterized protein n=1 Tax=Paraburkholderia solitsugae TaxID=2675748 RepID=A0ABX2BKU5_9BURK|nr:hypothetical protein [Paraburkholderia solitsugae]